MVLSDPIEIRTPVSANNSLQNDKEDDPVADAIITKYHIGKKNIKLAILTVDNEYYAKIDSFNLLTKSDIQNIYIDCHDNAYCVASVLYKHWKRTFFDSNVRQLYQRE